MNLWQLTFLQNDFQDWMLALLTVIGVWITLYLVKRIVVRRLHKFAPKTETHIDDLAASLSEKTSSFIITILSLYAGSLVLTFPFVVGRWIAAVAFIFFIIQIGIWSNILIEHWVQHYGREEGEPLDPTQTTTLNAASFVIRLIVFSMLLLVALDNIPGVEVTALIASLGIGGVAVALAVQNILGDLFASLSIALDKPFVIGDFIIVGDYMGTVEYVGLKTTRVRSLWGEELIFSNSDLLGSRIRNYKKLEERRVAFNIGVTYDTTAEQLRQIPPLIQNFVESLEKTRFDRAHFNKFGDSALNFEIVYYVLEPDYNVYMDIQQAINLHLLEEFNARGIEFAFPTRMVYVSMEEEEEDRETAVSPPGKQRPSPKPVNGD